MNNDGKREQKIRRASQTGIRRWVGGQALASPERQAFLDAMRKVGDPVTDPMIEAIFASEGNEGLKKLNQFLQHWDAPITDEVPQSIRAFLEAPVKYPDWVDMDQVEQAPKMFVKWGMQALLTLFLKSLPQYFSNEGAAHVFYRDKVFDKENEVLKRFIIEVIQLIIDVMEPGSLMVEPKKGVGVLALQKLRLHHSIIRHHILHPVHADPWNLAAWGTPINQEDLAGASVAFTVYNLEGFKKLDLKLTEQEKDVTLMIWKIICFHLGLDERLQPADRAEAEVLLRAIEERQSRSSEAGTTLIRQLLNIIRGFLPFPIKNVPILLMRYLVDRRYIKLMKIPRTFGLSWFSMSLVVLLVSVFRLYNWLIGRFFPRLQVFILEKSYKFLTRRLFPRFIKGVTQAEGRHGNRGAFRLPGWTEDPQRKGVSVKDAKMWQQGRKKSALPSPVRK